MDFLLEEKEDQTVHYFCLASDDYRYDFIAIFSNFFYGKTIIMSMQTERFVLLCQEDIENEEVWVDRLGVQLDDIQLCKDFLYSILTQHHLVEQY